MYSISFSFLKTTIAVVIILILLHKCLYLPVRNCGPLYGTMKRKKAILALNNIWSIVFPIWLPSFSFASLMTRSPVHLLWLHHVETGHDFETSRQPRVSEGLAQLYPRRYNFFSYALGGFFSAPGITGCSSKVCPFSLPKAVDKLLCLDT